MDEFETEFDSWDELISYVEEQKFSIFDVVDDSIVFISDKYVGQARRKDENTIGVEYNLVVK